VKVGLDFLFQETPNIPTWKQTVKPGDAREDTALKPGFDIVIFQTLFLSVCT
jgi:hypothetical protein